MLLKNLISNLKPEVGALKIKGISFDSRSIKKGDLLLDDSLFMYGRWLSYGSNAEIIIVPGADHAFNAFPSETTTSVENKISEFVKSLL